MGAKQLKEGEQRWSFYTLTGNIDRDGEEKGREQKESGATEPQPLQSLKQRDWVGKGKGREGGMGGGDLRSSTRLWRRFRVEYDVNPQRRTHEPCYDMHPRPHPLSTVVSLK